MRRFLCCMTAVVVAVGVAVAQPKKPDDKGAGAGSGSAKPGAGTGSAKAPGPGAGSGSAAKPTPPPDTGGKKPPREGGPDVDALRQEYLQLRDELFASRARAATVASQLYSTKVSVRMTYTSARMYGVGRAVIRLDGASVYDNTAGAIAGDDAIRFEGYIAPGRHVITFRIEANGKDDPRFTTATESAVVVQAVAGKDLSVAAKAKDGGDMPYKWKKSESGSYKLGLEIEVKSVGRAKAAAPRRGSRAATASR